MQPQPLIAVHNVQSSSQWYQHLLGLQSAHGGDEYERLTHQGRLVLQLHHWDAHQHPYLGNPDSLPYGNGVLLWFMTDDFDEAMNRAQTLKAEILIPPFINPRANHRECWLRDPNGYIVVLASHHY